MGLSRMNRREAIRYIHEETVISPEQRISLTQMLFKHLNNFDSLCSWIKCLTAFASEAYHGLRSFERMEVVRTLIRGVEEKISNETFGKLVEIFFGQASYFLKAVLIRLQKEEECQVRALMAQLLLHFSNYPIEGSSLEDYLPGIHHRDELFRCKILHFLYKHYGGEALSAILQEVIKIVPPPSLFFSMTLNHYLRLHPEMKWEEEIQRTIWSRNNFFGNQNEKDRILVLVQQMQHSILRHDFLSLIHTCEQPELQISHESEGNLTSRRLERFEKIDSLPKEK